MIEPKISSANHSDPKNPYQGRWRWWYPGIADWIIRNPDGKIEDCAKSLGKAYITVSYIIRTDLFQEYLAQRRAMWQKEHDFSIISKMTKVAERGLDVLLDKMEKQHDKIPMQLVTEVVVSSLDRLGYGPKQASPVSVNVNTGPQYIAISPAALEEARDAIRVAEQKKAAAARQTIDLIAVTADEVGSAATVPHNVIPGLDLDD